MDSHELLDSFRQRPAMYTGERTLNAIHLFLTGYRFACDQHGIVQDDALLVPREFHDWVAYRLHFFESTSGWCNMILARSEGEQAAIETFFRLLDEFRDRKPHVVAMLNGYRKTYEQFTVHRVNGQAEIGPTEALTYPDSVSLVTYTDDPGFFAYSNTADKFPYERFFPNLEIFEMTTVINRAMLTIVDEQWRLAETC